MFRTLKKQFKKHEAACVAILVVYLAVVLGISANHTCEVCHRYCRNSDSYNQNFQSDCNSCTDIQSYMALRQSDNQPELRHSQTQCAACLYSTIAKSFRSRINSRLINPTILRILRILPFTTVIKQSEWRSSISLRAPPIKAS
jgi:hypothetical protein